MTTKAKTMTTKVTVTKTTETAATRSEKTIRAKAAREGYILLRSFTIIDAKGLFVVHDGFGLTLAEAEDWLYDEENRYTDSPS